MKNIFGINVTQDKKNTDYDGKVFVTKGIDNGLSNSLDDIEVEYSKMIKNGQMPLWLGLFYFISWGYVLIFILGNIRAVTDSNLTFKQAYHNAPALYYLALFFLISFIILFIFKKKKMKNAIQSDEFKNLETSLNQMINEANEQLEIPENAEEIDVFSFKYIIDKNGKRKIKNNSINLYDYQNFVVKIYATDEKFYLYDLKSRYEIPLTAFKEIKRIKKLSTLTTWNKEEPINSKQYKIFKVYANSNGMITCRYYYSILIEDIYGEYELLVPPYDIEKIANMIHLEYEK